LTSLDNEKIVLSKCQKKLLLILRNRLSLGVSPTYEELAKEYGCVKSNVHKLLYKLRSKGWVDFISASKGGIKLL
jgi:DNA-binding IscR family transcriptional regulator